MVIPNNHALVIENLLEVGLTSFFFHFNMNIIILYSGTSFSTKYYNVFGNFFLTNYYASLKICA